METTGSSSKKLAEVLAFRSTDLTGGEKDDMLRVSPEVECELVGGAVGGAAEGMAGLKGDWSGPDKLLLRGGGAMVLVVWTGCGAGARLRGLLSSSGRSYGDL